LRNFKDIKQELRSNALDAIVAYLAARGLQAQPPGIGVLRS
jgi:hypothetical protein